MIRVENLTLRSRSLFSRIESFTRVALCRNEERHPSAHEFFHRLKQAR
jgi:hypothetical protein